MSSSHIYIAWLPSRDQVAWQNGGSHACERLWKQIKEVKNRSFHSFGLKDILLKRLKDMNIEKPTAIQEKVCLEFAGAD